MDDERKPVRLERRDGVAVLTIDNPPVNALSAQVVAQLGEAVAAFAQDAALRALVVACAGRTFVAGGDIAAFDDPAFSAAPLNRTLARLEALDRPVVAAPRCTAMPTAAGSSWRWPATPASRRQPPGSRFPR